MIDRERFRTPDAIAGREEPTSLPKASKKFRRTSQPGIPTLQDIIDNGGDFRTAREYTRLRSTSPNPGAFDASIPRPQTPDALAPESQETFDYISKVESAWEGANSPLTRLPISWLVQQETDDLAFLSDPEIMPTLIEEIISHESFAASKAKFDRQIETRANELLTGRAKLWNNVENQLLLSGNPVGLFIESDTTSDEARAAARTQAELELMANPFEPPKEPGFFETAGEFIMTGFSSIVTAGSHLVGGAIWAYDKVAGNNPLAGETLYDVMEQSHNERVGSALTQARERLEVLSNDEAALMESAKETFGEGWFEQLHASGQAQEFMTMGLNDAAAGRALMEVAGTIIFEESAELRNQVMTAEYDAAEDIITELANNDFNLDGGIASAVAWWSHNTGMRFGTYLTEFMGQDDITDVFTDRGFTELHERAVQADFSPAKSLGIDGTWQGSVLDFTLGTILDPINLLFGPTAKAGVAGISHVDDVARIAASPGSRQLLRDAAQTIRSYFRDDNAIAALMEDFDQWGMYDEVHATAIGVENVLPNRPWLSHPSARITKETPTSTIERLVPEQVWRDGEEILAGADRTAMPLRPETPVRLVFDPVAKGFTLSADDAARLLAAREQGIDAFPVYGVQRQVSLGRQALTPEQVALVSEIVSNPENFAFHGTVRVSDEVAERMLAREETFTRGGLDPDYRRAESYASETRPTVSKWGTAGRQARLGQDRVFVFRRSELPPEAQSRLAAGRAVEELFPGGAATTPVYPAFSFTRGQWDEMLEATTPTRVADVNLHKLDNFDDFSLPQLLDESVLYPAIDEIMPKLQAQYERLLKLGGGNSVPMRTVMSRIMAEDMRHAFKKQPIGSYFNRYMSKQNTGNWIRTRGFGWESEIRQTIFRMFGHDAQTANLWMRRFRETLKLDRSADDFVARQVRIRELADEVKALQDRVDIPEGTMLREAEEGVSLIGLDKLGEAVEVAIPATTRNALARLNTAKNSYARAIRELAEYKVRSHNTRSVAAQKFLEELYDDFRARYINTNSALTHLRDADGNVPWEALTGGVKTPRSRSGFRATEGVSDVAGEINQMLPQFLDDPDGGFLAPMAPIDMIAASTLDGAKWLRWQQYRLGQNVRNTGNLLDRLWKIDKVFRISTAITVSFDELLRVFSRFGSEAPLRWIEDKLMSNAGRAKVATTGSRGNALGKGFGEAVDASRAIFSNDTALGRRWNKRMRTLQEYPEFYKQLERQYYENFGDSWADLDFGDSEWLPAMERWTGNFLQHPGMRASLQGPEEFSRFWNSEEAASLRNQTAFDWGSGHTRIVSESEAFNGYQYIYEKLFLDNARSGRRGAVDASFKEAAGRIATGEVEVVLAPSILRDIPISVRGIRNLAPNTPISGRMSNAFFDALYMGATNYRRGFIADLVRKREMQRLRSLYQSEGITVKPDWMVDEVFGPDYPTGMGNIAREGIIEGMEVAAFERGIVFESTLRRLAERKAMQEIEHIMYSWQTTSRAGRSAVSRAVFPFGKPYYDMWAYQARETLMRPALRGYLNRSNIANKMVDYMPFNPKPAALISRIAATDFEAEKQGLDFSPLLFLPKEGESALLSVLPGVGLIPMWLLDTIVTGVHDPFEEPEEYQALTAAISQFIPSFGYQQTGLIGRAFGGGLVATATKTSIDMLMIGSGRSFHSPLALLGDIQSEIQGNRALKALLADPTELEALMSADSRQVEAMLEGLIDEAIVQGALPHAAELGVRWFVPVEFDFDTSDDDAEAIWLDAAVKFPQLAPRNFNRQGSEADRAEYADDIRRAFFALSGVERDRLIVEYPQLAVNMVGGWEWTDKAEDDFPLDASTPYRITDGSLGLARHQSYIRNDYIRPLAPSTLLYRILGSIFEARIGLATQTYSAMANSVNDYIWENVMPEAGKQFFEDVVSEGTVDASSGREVWQDLDQYSDKLVAEYGAVAVPERLRAWGTSWRGLDDEGFSQRFREITLGEEWSEFTPEILENARVLGLELERGMTGEQFVAQIHDQIRENMQGSPLPSLISQEYSAYRNARSAVTTAGRDNLNRLIAGRNANPVLKATVQDFMDYADRTLRLRNEGLSSGIDPERGKKVVEMYQQLITSNPDLQFSWEDTWTQTYSADFGALDYEYQQPPEFDMNNPERAYRPFIWDIRDGDTLIVSNEESASWLDLPGVQLDVPMEGTEPRKHAVRLLGINAAELGTEEGKRWLDELTNAIMDANENGTPIFLVRDPASTGGRNVDFYGRELAWLFIGNVPWYHPETIKPGD